MPIVKSDGLRTAQANVNTQHVFTVERRVCYARSSVGNGDSSECGAGTRSRVARVSVVNLLVAHKVIRAGLKFKIEERDQSTRSGAVAFADRVLLTGQLRPPYLDRLSMVAGGVERYCTNEE